MINICFKKEKIMGVPSFYRPGNTTLLLLFVCCLLATTLFLGNTNNNNNGNSQSSSSSSTVLRYRYVSDDTDKDYFIQQRNHVSRLLNEEKKALGQQSCQMKKLTKSQSVSTNGGWCADRSGTNSTEHKCDELFSKALSSFLKGKHIGSFGDGPGKYKDAVTSHNEVASYTAYDGAPFCETTTGGKVHFLDLTGPQYGLPAFDWVMSVEVGEHIPQVYEDVYLNNLVRHAKEGVILSWATPGQGGYSHINNQPLSHVVDQMTKRGFHHSRQESDWLRKSAEFYWLKKNVNVFRRTDFNSFQPLDV